MRENCCTDTTTQYTNFINEYLFARISRDTTRHRPVHIFHDGEASDPYGRRDAHRRQSPVSATSAVRASTPRRRRQRTLTSTQYFSAVGDGSVGSDVCTAQRRQRRRQRHYSRSNDDDPGRTTAAAHTVVGSVSLCRHRVCSGRLQHTQFVSFQGQRIQHRVCAVHKRCALFVYTI